METETSPTLTAPPSHSDSFGGQAEIKSLPLDQLRPNPWNRTVFDPVAMEELVASIRANGVEEPLIVRRTGENQYEIASGNRRWLAGQKAGLAELPCVIRELPDEEVAAANITLNVQRESLSPLEMARMVKGYMDQFNKSQQEAAQKFGKSQPWVSDLTGFLKMPPEVQENIRALIIGWDPLVALKKAPPEVQLQVSQELRDGLLKPAQIEKRCHQLRAGSGSGSQQPGQQIPQQVADGYLANQGFRFEWQGDKILMTALLEPQNQDVGEFLGKAITALQVWMGSHPQEAGS